MLPPELATHWSRLVTQHAIKHEHGNRLLAELIVRYSEPHRSFHTLEHLSNMFQSLTPLALNSPTVDWAVWYHDIVYLPGSAQNEAKSAELAVTRLLAAELPRSLCERVGYFIRCTKGHHVKSNDFALNAFLDADLSILGSGCGAYKRYTRGIRREHRRISRPRFTWGRRAFLKHMLAAPHIYRTDYFRQRFESQARKNLWCELHR